MDLDQLAVFHADNLIKDEIFIILYDVNWSKNLEVPYWNYRKFDPELYTDDECLAYFRFSKNDLYVLSDALSLPVEGFTSSNGTDYFYRLLLLT